MTVTRADILAAKTQEQSKELIGLLVDDFTALRTELSAKEETIKDHAEKLRLTQQRLAEIKENEKNLSPLHGAEGEGELRHYLDEDGGLRLQTDERAHKAGEDAPTGLLDGLPACEWQRELQRAFGQRTLVRIVKGAGKQAPNDALHWNSTPQRGGIATPILDRRIRQLIRTAPPAIAAAIRAMGDETGKGGDYIVPPTMPGVRDNIHVESSIGGLFNVVNLDHGGMDIPTVGSGLVPFRRGLPSGATPGNTPLTTLSTGKDSVRPEELAVGTAFHERASERAIVNFYDVISRKGGAALGYALADAIVNGNREATPAIDSYAPGGTMWDPRSIFGYSEASGYPVALDHRNGIFEGLRNRAKRVDTGSHWVDANAGFTMAMLQEGMGNLEGPLGADGDLCLTLSREAFFKHVAGWSQIQTVDKYGPRATVHTREVASVAGARIILEDFVTADLNASGVYDGTTTNTTSAMLFNRAERTLYLEEGVRIRTQAVILNGLIYVVIVWSGMFQDNGPDTRKNVVNFYKIAS